MTFAMPDDGSLSTNLFIASLPQAHCSACDDLIPRRKHRVAIRASWRDGPEVLCPACWWVICQWAQRFALKQLHLDLGVDSASGE